MTRPKRSKKKKSSDYKRFDVHCKDEEELNHVNSIVEEIQNFMNDRLEDDQKRYLKKEIVFMLLEEGEKVIRRKYRR